MKEKEVESRKEEKVRGGRGVGEGVNNYNDDKKSLETNPAVSALIWGFLLSRAATTSFVKASATSIT